MPERISFQIAAEVAQGKSRVKLRECLAPTFGFDESYLANPLCQIAAGQLALSGGIRKGRDGAHKRAPGKLSYSQCADHTVGWWLKRFDVRNVSGKFFRQECINFRIQIGSLNRSRLRPSAIFVWIADWHPRAV